MAIYQYKCEKCNTTQDIHKPMKDYAREEFCDSCGEKLKRVFEATHNKWNCDGSFARGSF